MSRLPRVALAPVTATLLLAGPLVAQGTRPGPNGSPAPAAGVHAAPPFPAAARTRTSATTVSALPPSALTGRTVIFSETVVGEHAGPYLVTLAGGSVYRLEVRPAGAAGGPFPDAAVSNAHWLLDDESSPYAGVTITPRLPSGAPVQLLRPLDAGARAVGGLELLLRPPRSGEYRIDATAAGGATYLIRVIRQDADEVEHACIRERDAGEPGVACAEWHAARRSLNRFGGLTRPVAALLFLAAGVLLGL